MIITDNEQDYNLYFEKTESLRQRCLPYDSEANSFLVSRASAYATRILIAGTIQK